MSMQVACQVECTWAMQQTCRLVHIDIENDHTYVRLTCVQLASLFHCYCFTIAAALQAGPRCL